MVRKLPQEASSSSAMAISTVGTDISATIPAVAPAEAMAICATTTTNPNNNASEAEAKREAEAGSDNDSEICDLAIDGAGEDEILKKSEALTQQEVVRRRNRRVKQLMKLYRLQYWGLLEELRSKYRVFYIKHGRGGWRDEVEPEKEKKMHENGGTDANMEVEVVADGREKNAKGNDSAVRGNEKNANGHENVPIKGNENHVKSGVVVGVMREPLTPEKSIGEIIRCANQGCKSKPMALGMFCFSHILSDPRQQLYRPCTFVTRSGQSGTVTCGKPVLRSMVPLYCPAHIQKQPTRGVRKANNNVVTAATKVAGPKLHLVIAEYVRLIQTKRRAARDSALKHVSGSPSCVKID